MKFEQMTGKSIRKAFLAFHAKNPKVYELFMRYCEEALSKGKKKLSSKLIINRIRWEVFISTEDDHSVFRINDAYTAHYARQFMDDYPIYRGFFELRELRS